MFTKCLYKNVPSSIIKNSKKKKKKSTDVENKLRLPRREESGTNWDTGIDGKFFLIKKSKK